MLKLSKKSDYGLIAVRHLAAHEPGGACSAKEIAAAYGIPAELLAKVLQKLVKSGVLVSQHGVDGGYALARPPASVTAFDVINAIDGPVAITSCVTPHGDCCQAQKCTVREPLGRLNEIIARALSSVTMAGLDEHERNLVRIEARP